MTETRQAENEKPQEARNSMVNLEFVSGEEAIQTLTDMFGIDEVIRIARKHEQTTPKMGEHNALASETRIHEIR